MSFEHDIAELVKYIDDAKAAGDGDRVSGEPLADYIRRLRAELAEARLRNRLHLVVIKDKELAGEPDVGVGLIEGDTSDAHNAGCKMLDALAERGRHRCTARTVEIERGRFYRATMWFRTAPVSQ